jgi:hypothetical protein
MSNSMIFSALDALMGVSPTGLPLTTRLSFEASGATETADR